MALDSKEILNGSKDAGESLSLARTLESSHPPFTLPSSLLEDLGSVVLMWKLQRLKPQHR